MDEPGCRILRRTSAFQGIALRLGQEGRKSVSSQEGFRHLKETPIVWHLDIPELKQLDFVIRKRLQLLQCFVEKASWSATAK